MGLFNPGFALLPGLKPACWRGLSFWMPDASSEVGRRVIVTYFPGVDDPAIEDLGRGDGLVRIRGLIIGDDYVAQALALMAALHAPGPGTFLHPWLGEMTAIVPPAGGLISFTTAELRVARFEVVLQPIRPFGAFGGLTSLPILNTLAAVTSAVTRLVSAVRAFGLVGIGGGAVLGTATWSAACETAVACADLVAAACDEAPACAVFGPAVTAPAAAVSAAVAGAAGLDSAGSIASALVDLSVGVADLAIGSAPSAVAPGPSAQVVEISAPEPVADSARAVLSPVAGPRSGAALLLAAAEDVAQLPAHGAPAEAARLAARLGLLAQAVRASLTIGYESRQDASTWRGALDDALSAAADTLADASAGGLVLAAPAAAVWQALDGLRADLARDMHETLGRLPEVATLTPAAPVSAWLLAQHLAGDDPAAVVDMMDDLVRRNRARHPAMMSGPVEYLPR